MHMVIRIINYAESANEAATEAERIAKQLSCNECNKPFDYYTMGGRNPSEEFRPTVLAASPEGHELIGKGWTYQETEINRAMAQVRAWLASHEDEDVFTRQGEFDFRYRCNLIGQYSGDAVWLYDNDGEGIRTAAHLEDVLAKWKCLHEDQGKPNPYASLDIYVTPVDVHY